MKYKTIEHKLACYKNDLYTFGRKHQFVLNSTFKRPRSSNETLLSFDVKTNPKYFQFFSAYSESRKVQNEFICQKC